MIFCVKKYESVISLSSTEKKESANICILRCEIHDCHIDHYIFIKTMNDQGDDKEKADATSAQDKAR